MPDDIQAQIDALKRRVENLERTMSRIIILQFGLDQRWTMDEQERFHAQWREDNTQ